MNKPKHRGSEDDLAAGWIMRMATGEADALAALYRLYHRPLLSILLGILRNRQLAEEVLQDTFVKAFHNAGSYNPSRGVAFAWLVTIGRRLAIDRIRRERARPDTKTMEQPDGQIVHFEGESGEDIQQNVEYNWLDESMQVLSRDQRRVIEMAFFQGYTHNEISQKLNLPVGTVKSHMYRGLDALRKEHLGEQ